METMPEWSAVVHVTLGGAGRPVRKKVERTVHLPQGATERDVINEALTLPVVVVGAKPDEKTIDIMIQDDERDGVAAGEAVQYKGFHTGDTRLWDMRSSVCEGSVQQCLSDNFGALFGAAALRTLTAAATDATEFE